jgi:superfamily II DNA or RNA helicase
MRSLRDYQAEAVDKVRTGWSSGVNRQAVVHATGLGKTTLIAHFAAEEAARGGQVLILAHRAKLLRQISATVREFRPDLPVGVVAGVRDQRGFPITCAMTSTLARANRRARLARPSLVIYDEAHHAPAVGNQAIMQWAGCYDSVRALGVTATLVRGDKLKPSLVWPTVADERDIAWGCTHGPDPADPLRSIGCELGDGWLVPPRARVVVLDHLDLGKAKVSRGDFQSGELAEMITQDVDQIAKAWAEHASDRSTVAFMPSVAAAQALAAEFEALGVPVGLVLGAPHMTEAQQERVYADLDADRIRVMCSVMVPTEGYDCARVSCVIPRPTKLPGLLAQMVGRMTRRYPGKVDGLVLDPYGVTRVTGLASLTDLSPMFQVDRSELDALPCEACGGFRARAVAADPDLNPCSCVREVGAGRDPDGGRARLLGPATYVDMPLLPDPRARFRWQRSRLGVPFLMGSLPQCRDRAGILWPDTGHADSPTWTPGYVAVRGPSSWVRLGPADGCMTFATAQLTVQGWAGSSPRVPSGPAPEWLVGKAAALGVPDPGRLDRRGLSAAVDVARVSLVVDR